MRTKVRFLLEIILIPLLALPVARLAGATAKLDDPRSATENFHLPAGHPIQALPMSFEANAGQFADDVKFRSRGAGYSVVLFPTEAVLLLGDRKVQKRPQELEKRSAQSKRGSHREPSVQLSASAVVHLSIIGANAEAEVVGESRLPGIANYFLGNDPALWRTAVPTYEKVFYRGIYPGIDLVYYGNQRQLEYDFIVAPGTKPDKIRIRLDGVDGVSVDAGGDLIAQIGTRHLRWQKPRAYQVEARGERTVAAEFVVDAANQISFRVGAYDVARPLIIDPLLVYSSFLGGADFDSVAATAVDNSGNVYLAGTTYSTNFPVFKAYQTNAPSRGTNADAFVTKLNSDATALVFSTYFGGSDLDGANGIAVDTNGNVYVVGGTYSLNFPTRNAFQTSKGNFNDAFLTKFGPFGTNILYSTYYGDSGGPSGYGDEAFGVAVNNSGDAYIVGETESGSALYTKAPIQNGFGGGASDALVARFDTTQSGNNSLVWGSWLGGSFDEHGYGIALDSVGNVYITGYMLMVTCYDSMTFLPCPPDFPTLAAFQPSFGGNPLEVTADAFIVKINNSSSPSRVFATYLGGSGDDFGYGIAVDSSNNVYVAGETTSTDFPVLNAQQPAEADGGFYSDAFVAKFSSSGTNLLYSTYFGGRHLDGARSIVLDRFRNAYVVGYTFSPDFPVTPGAPQTLRGGGATNFNRDVFVAKLNPAVPGPSSLVFATYFGGSEDEAITGGGNYADHPGIGLAVDTNLDIYIGSDTLSTNLPGLGGGVFQLTPGGGGDAFAAKFSPPADVSVANIASTNLVIVGSNLVYTLYANNNGLGSFSDVTVTDPLPAALQFVSGTNNFGTISNFQGTVTCTFGTLTNGGGAVATINTVPLQPGTITNRASLAASPTDLNTNNNVSRVVTVILGIADLAFMLSASPNPVLATSNLTYSITLTNQGPWPASNLRVTSPFPPGANFVSLDSVRAVFTGGQVVWLPADLTNGGSATLSIVMNPIGSILLLTNQATVSAYQFDPVASNNTASVVTTVTPVADLALGSLIGDQNPVLFGSNLTYTIKATNSGPSLASATQVVDPLPAGLTFVSAQSTLGSCTQFQGVVTCNLGNLSSGAVATVTIVAKPGLVGLLTNTASISSPAVDFASSNNSISTVTTVNPLANLSLLKSVVSSPVIVTSNLVYTLSVSNLGPTFSSGVTVTDPLPPNTVYVSAQSSQGFCTADGGIVTCNLGTLTNGGSATISVVVTPMLEGNITNVATVASGTADFAVGNNTSSALAFVTNHPAGPILRIAMSGTNVVLYWTTNSAGYVLQARSGSITGSTWQQVTNVPVVRGTQFFVTNAVGSAPTLYRLSKTIPVPALSATLSGATIRISWPTNLVGYLLQATATLSVSNYWITFTNPPAMQAGRFYILDEATNTARFYRLFASG